MNKHHRQLDQHLRAAAAELVETLASHGATVAVCESLTAGMVGAAIAGVPGASRVFVGGLITYATSMKHTLAGVDTTILEGPGPVSPECAKHMALGAVTRLGADYGVALTGVAGPDPVGVHPVGEVWAGFADDSHRCTARRVSLAGYERFAQLRGSDTPVTILHGDRLTIRQAAAIYALTTLQALILQQAGE